MRKQSLKIENPWAYMHRFIHEREREIEADRQTDTRTETEIVHRFTCIQTVIKASAMFKMLTGERAR